MNLNAKRRLLAVAAAASVLASAMVWCGRDKPAPPPGPRAQGDQSQDGGRPMIAATGRIECRKEASVRAKSPGRVVRYAKKEGEWAQEGSAVVLTDDGIERAALREAEAELFKTEAAFRRLKPLAAKGVASAQELDDADAGHRLALARVERAKAALEERVVRAPFAGRILKTYLEAGETANPLAVSPLFVIGDDRTLRVTAEVDELDVSRVAEGLAAVVIPDAYPGESFPGKVVKVGRMLGRKTIASDNPAERMDAKVLEVEVELAPSEKLKRGLGAQVRILPRPGPGRAP
ncbi:MAG: efflux RND transporter periplasmic adaptor subunit [Elusimicrobia bacterium]|nr:efflux RND transporter periplasmic adaptor subunit [Elusimicrobiota bacterium]